jgi:hypothetical protein
MLNSSQDTDYYRKLFQSGEKIHGIEEYACETEFCVTESVKM